MTPKNVYICTVVFIVYDFQFSGKEPDPELSGGA